MTDNTIPTRGQLERTLSQRIQALYRTQLGHKPGDIQCHICEEKITIILEDSITKPELLLAENGHEDLAKQVRSEIDELLQTQLKALIEEIVKTPVIDLLSNAKLETGRTGTIAVLANPPQIRSTSS